MGFWSELLIQKIILMTYNQAISKAMAICSKAEKCISDIETKLQTWEVTSDDSKKIIKTLIEEKFIDQERYARFFVRDKFRFNHWGRVKIAYMLKGKRVSAELIQQALEEIGDDTYIETLSGLLKEKAHKTKSVNEYDLKGKLYRFAQSRGFEYEVIGTALKNIDKKLDD
jgi:regulatory protein